MKDNWKTQTRHSQHFFFFFALIMSGRAKERIPYPIASAFTMPVFSSFLALHAESSEEIAVSHVNPDTEPTDRGSPALLFHGRNRSGTCGEIRHRNPTRLGTENGPQLWSVVYWRKGALLPRVQVLFFNHLCQCG